MRGTPEARRTAPSLARAAGHRELDTRVWSQPTRWGGHAAEELTRAPRQVGWAAPTDACVQVRGPDACVLHPSSSVRTCRVGEEPRLLPVCGPPGLRPWGTHDSRAPVRRSEHERRGVGPTALLRYVSHSLYESSPWISNDDDGRRVTLWALSEPALCCVLGSRKLGGRVA